VEGEVVVMCFQYCSARVVPASPSVAVLQA
jgi:hypothetical protein